MKQPETTATRWRRKLALAVALLALDASCDGCGGGGGGGGGDAGPLPSLESITVAPATATVPVGGTASFTANLKYDTAPPRELPAVEWSVSDPGVARIDAQGIATGRAPGTVVITAVGGGRSGTAQLIVMAPVVPRTLTGVTVQPVSGSLQVGTTVALTATGSFSDGTGESVTARATWSSANPAIATVAPDGTVSAVSAGSTAVSAAFQGLSASATITVTEPTLASLAIAPPALSLPQGQAHRYTATATYTNERIRDVTAEVIWASSHPAVATISNEAGSRGQVTAVGMGQTMISATLGGQATSVALIVITGLVELALDPPAASMASGSTLALSARGLFTDGTVRDLSGEVTWLSSASQVVGVASGGRASGLAPGTATVTAQWGAVVRSSAIIVSATPPVALAFQTGRLVLAAQTSRPLVLVGVFADGSTQELTESAQWSSAAPAVASVSSAADSRGRVRGMAAGTTTVTASFGGQSARASVTVTAARPDSLSILPGPSQIARGTALPLRARAAFSDGTTQDVSDQVMWESSSNTIGSLSVARGAATLAGMAPGVTMVSAHLGALNETVPITVTAATLSSLSVVPTSTRVPRATTVALRASGRFSDETTQDLTGDVFWSAVNPGLASVSNAPGREGVASGLQAGVTEVGVRLLGVGGSGGFEITAAMLTAIAVTPENPSLARGLTRPLLATGTFSDGSTRPLDREATWTSSDQNRVAVSSVPGSAGLATALDEGTATVTVRVGSVTGSTLVTVGPAAVAGLAITPTEAAIPRGVSIDLRAAVEYTDGSRRDVTAQTVWESGAPGVASISNDPATLGRVTGKLVGSVTITASQAGLFGFATVRITSATLTGLSILPTAASAGPGAAVQFEARGAFSDGSTFDVTRSATWASSQPQVATISTDPGSEGHCMTIAAGSTIISATFMDAMSTTTLTVGP